MKVDNSLSIGNKIDITISPALLESLGKMSVLFAGLEYFVILSISNLIPRTHSNFIFRLVGGDNFRVLLFKFKKIFLFQVKDLELLLNYSYHFLQSALGNPPVITTQQKLDKVDDKEKPKQ